MRRAPTPTEATLWEYLRRRQISGVKFRRQHIIAGWIVDFYCPQLRLAIEVDGPVHDSAEDAARDETLFELGIQVLRVTNDDVEQHIDDVIERIRDVCNMRK